jgi:hypothetical protein
MRVAILLTLLSGILAMLCADNIKVFDKAALHFTPDDSTRYDSPGVKAEDYGRVLVTRTALPGSVWSGKIFGNVQIESIAMDSMKVRDKWDRAGAIYMTVPGYPDLELIKFITAYGGPTEHCVELSHLRPLLIEQVEFKAFVDTWASPGWHISFDLEFIEEPNPLPSDWVLPLIYEEAVTAEYQPKPVHVDIPKGTMRVELYYLVSGHCTDGTDADEFESKFNVVKVDGREVLRYKPWRNDCTKFRAINPYTRHWPDGTWSSDYSRSGWCPGDWVRPLVTDLRMDLTPGAHEMEFVVENVRPKDENGHHGYWRVSAYLVGWKD